DQCARPTLRFLQSDVGQSFPAQQNQSAPNADQQHFNNCIQDKPLLQIDRHLNKSTESRIEKERHRQEYNDVDQITPPPTSATSFGVVFCHSLEIIISAQHRKTNLEVPRREWSRWESSDIKEARRVSERERANGAGGTRCDIDAAKRRSQTENWEVRVNQSKPKLK